MGMRLKGALTFLGFVIYTPFPFLLPHQLFFVVWGGGLCGGGGGERELFFPPQPEKVKTAQQQAIGDGNRIVPSPSISKSDENRSAARAMNGIEPRRTRDEALL